MQSFAGLILFPFLRQLEYPVEREEDCKINFNGYHDQDKKLSRSKTQEHSSQDHHQLLHDDAAIRLKHEPGHTDVPVLPTQKKIKKRLKSIVEDEDE